jgi:hypothetical protein
MATTREGRFTGDDEESTLLPRVTRSRVSTVVRLFERLSERFLSPGHAGGGAALALLMQHRDRQAQRVRILASHAHPSSIR